MILPGATLGVLGGGQLGRIFVIAARRMGYRVIVLDPDPLSPAGQLADAQIRAAYTDADALAELAHACAAVTTEFENVPAESLEYLARHCVVSPRAAAVRVAQDRIHEKLWLREQSFATAPFAVIHTHADLEREFPRLGGPALLKVSRFGYDGKGQARVDDLAAALDAFQAVGGESCVLERLLPLETEISVVLARGADGGSAAFPVAENRHANGILELSIVPARVAAATARAALDMACAIATRLDYVGVLAVEFFVLAGAELRVNEIAPRPHNSGHYTLDACVSDQFEQQLRALCGLPLGDTRLLAPAVMLNLLGDVWCDRSPPWEQVLRHPQAKLHLYGKQDARPGRKMGHVNILGENLDAALAIAQTIRDDLRCRTAREPGGDPA